MSSPEAVVLRDAVEQLTRSLHKTLEMLTPAEKAYHSATSETPTMTKPNVNNPHVSEEEPSDEIGLFTSNFVRRPAAPRRETMMDRILRPDAGRIEATIYREQPNYDHVKLSSLSAASSFRFFQDIDKYESRYKAAIPAATLVADRVRDEILNEAPGLGVTEFYNLENDELFLLIQKAIKPRNALEFAKRLTATATFPSLPPGYQPTLQHFKPLYDCILIYQRVFLECFNFLAYENTRNVPRCDHRDGGLIRIFVDAIPGDFGQHVLSSLKSHKYDTLKDFTKAFMECIHGIKLTYESTRAHAQFFEGPIKLPQTRNATALAKASNMPLRRQPLAHMVGEDWYSTNGDDAPDEPHLYGDPVHDLNNLNAPSPTFDGGCYRKFSGACTKPNCRFKHDPKSMHELYLKQRKLLDNSPYKDPPPDYAAVSSRLSKTSRPTLATVISTDAEELGMEHASFHLPMDDDVDEPSLNAFLHSEPELQVANMVFAKLGVRSLHRSFASAAFHLADIFVGNSKLDTTRCLLDSGATTSSYLDARWIQPHRELLTTAGALRSIDANTTLADNVTQQVINESCTLTICLSWENHTWSADIAFMVMPSLTTPLIIGLPQILLHFRYLYIAKFLAFPGPSDSPLCSIFEDSIYPWQSPPDLLNAEEDIAHPCLFTEALHFMETTHDQALLDFRAQFDGHVAPEMRAETKIYDLLITKGSKVFVPSNWDGINGIDPIEFQWKEGMPERMMPRVRPINSKSFHNAKVEIERLQGYFLVPSQSPIASPLVIAPKNTPPYIRVCGDYVAVNKYILTGASIIPHVQKELEKIRGFSTFIDLDLTNSFHQLPLGPVTAEKLSLVTPWGQFRPKFLPEGVTPASGLLQKHVQEVFLDFADWTIVIFDNLLVLAHSYADAYDKLESILDRCIQRNLFLKFAKSWFGMREVKFFGYLCRHNSYGMTPERKESILSAPMPTNTKSMQSFLGAAIFFKSFVPDFSTHTAELHDMTKPSFNWDPATWKYDYAAIYQRCKLALANATELVYPDYNLEWTLRVDASDKGVGSVLFQTLIDHAGNVIHQPISFGSKKFSETAQRWHTFEKEAFGIYFGVQSNDYFLRGKMFLLETDHRNLLWIEKSQNPKVIRWLMYLQGFVFHVRHIAGMVNTVADWASRLHALAGDEESQPLSKLDILHICHDDRSGHLGIKRTWALIKERYPDSDISMQTVTNFVTECSVCQKVRTDLSTPIRPIIRHLAQPHHRSAIGVDILSLPRDANGNVALYVIRNIFTKLVVLHPTKNHTADALASCLFSFFATFGLYDSIRSDPGSNLLSDAVTQLNRWFGIHHVVSLVGRHTSSGVESANKQVIRYLQCLFTDSSIAKRWSDPAILHWVQLLMNIYDSNETGISPFVATFGSSDQEYAKLPREMDIGTAHKFIATLDADLKLVRELVRKHQAQLVLKRTKSNPDSPAKYQAGDFVLLRNRIEHPPKSKLHPRSLGPYKVLKQVKNDILVESLIDARQRTLFVGDTLPFIGSAADAFAMAQLDDDQVLVTEFKSYRGEPRKRRDIEFQVAFSDGSLLWLPWSYDLFNTAAYEIFVNKVPALRPLLYTVKDLAARDKLLNRTPISEVTEGTVVFVDLRCYGYAWYASLALPDFDHLTYVVPYTYESFNSARTMATVYCHIFKERWKINHVFVVEYGMNITFDATFMVLVDALALKKFPTMVAKINAFPKNHGAVPDHLQVMFHQL